MDCQILSLVRIATIFCRINSYKPNFPTVAQRVALRFLNQHACVVSSVTETLKHSRWSSIGRPTEIAEPSGRASNENVMQFANREGDRALWCGRRDSNPHGLLRLDLNQVRLPFRHSRIPTSARNSTEGVSRPFCVFLEVWNRTVDPQHSVYDLRPDGHSAASFESFDDPTVHRRYEDPRLP